MSRKKNEKVVTPCNRNKRKQPIKAIRLPRQYKIRRKVARNKLCIGGVVREWLAKEGARARGFAAHLRNFLRLASLVTGHRELTSTCLACHDRFKFCF